jgi:hypothetical protein
MMGMAVERLAAELTKLPADTWDRVHAEDYSRMRELMNSRQALPDSGAGYFEIEAGLQVHPVLGRLIECAPKQQRQFSRHRARALDDMRHADSTRKFGLRHAQLAQYLGQVFPRMGSRQLPGGQIGYIRKIRARQVFNANVHDAVLSMVINDFDVPCSTVAPFKTNPPLIIDANAPLVFTVAHQFIPVKAKFTAIEGTR